MTAIYFITGTDTGIGKTVLTALLVRHLRASGVRAMAVKPLCSGGRYDARILRRAQRNALTLDEINPWHFRAPLAPLLAARREQLTVKRADMLRFIRATAEKCEVLLVEGAGGLLTPLGENFDARDLILELRAKPIVVSSNRLGTINQVRLVLAALPKVVANSAQVVLMATSRPNQATRTNLKLLGEFVSGERVNLIPRLAWPTVLNRQRFPADLTRALGRLSIRTGS